MTNNQLTNGEKITVHLVHHTHDDVGWLATVDEYYTYDEETDTSVRKIYDNTIEALLEDSKRKFSLVEMKYFSMWWKGQSDRTKDQVRKLIRTG